MRAIATTAALLLAAMPAMAHAGTHDLTIEDLVLTFNPLNQATEFTFELTNDHASVSTGAIYARVTLNDQAVPGEFRVSGGGLAAGASGVMVVAIPLRVAAEGCITVFSTKEGSALTSELTCAITSGLSQAPVTVPAQPEDPQAPEVPTLPPVEPPSEPPTVPDVPTTPPTLP